ncbi:hypothetical protein DERP_014361 [Dermatophagoides pteronyssinus]|uniref:Uncharacterized protein n=1 Tax=Dermatophagoides pteronyssinus TaxID=6956 RepID=A0ABQ8IV06_DERPT|nr:hypothetical protein DERP_014361 [Dermatophagoides pteronyssinus]
MNLMYQVYLERQNSLMTIILLKLTNLENDNATRKAITSTVLPRPISSPKTIPSASSSDFSPSKAKPIVLSLDFGISSSFSEEESDSLTLFELLNLSQSSVNIR